MMRFLLLIPAIFLFLSNIPFIQEVNMDSMKEMLATDECCMNHGNMEGVCQKPATSKKDSKEEHCPQSKTESTCTCICLFQFAAPEQILLKFDDNLYSINTVHHSMIDQHWIDPFITGPWQPPDAT